MLLSRVNLKLISRDLCDSAIFECFLCRHEARPLERWPSRTQPRDTKKLTFANQVIRKVHHAYSFSLTHTFTNRPLSSFHACSERAEAAVRIQPCSFTEVRARVRPIWPTVSPQVLPSINSSFSRRVTTKVLGDSPGVWKRSFVAVLNGGRAKQVPPLKRRWIGVMSVLSRHRRLGENPWTRTRANMHTVFGRGWVCTCLSVVKEAGNECVWVFSVTSHGLVFGIQLWKPGHGTIWVSTITSKLVKTGCGQ